MIVRMIAMMYLGLFSLSCLFAMESSVKELNSSPIGTLRVLQPEEQDSIFTDRVLTVDHKKVINSKVMHIVPPKGENVLGLGSLFNDAKKISGYVDLELDQIWQINHEEISLGKRSQLSKDLLLISGGHGAISALYQLKFDDQYIREKVVEPLVQAGLTFKVILIDACESAGHLENFRPLLTKDGYFIGNLVPSTDAFYSIHILNQIVKQGRFELSTLKDPFQLKIDHYPFLDLILYSDHFYPIDAEAWIRKSALALKNEDKTLVYLQLISDLKKSLRNVQHKEMDSNGWRSYVHDLIRHSKSSLKSNVRVDSGSVLEQIWIKYEERVSGAGFNEFSDVESFMDKNLIDTELDSYLLSLIEDLQNTIHFSQQLVWSESEKKGWYDSHVLDLGPLMEVMGHSIDLHLDRMIQKSNWDNSHFVPMENFYRDLSNLLGKL